MQVDPYESRLDGHFSELLGHRAEGVIGMRDGLSAVFSEVSGFILTHSRRAEGLPGYHSGAMAPGPDNRRGGAPGWPDRSCAMT